MADASMAAEVGSICRGLISLPGHRIRIMKNQPTTTAPTRPDFGDRKGDMAERELSTRLFEHLRRLNAIAPEDLTHVRRMQPPPAPYTIAETGVSEIVL